MRTPPMRPEDNRVEQTTRVHVGNDGSTRCVRTASFHGSAALSQRDAWLEVPAGERRRVMTAELQDANSKTRLVRLDVDEAALRDFDRPVRGEVVFEVPGHFSGQTNREGSVTDSKVWGKLLSYNLDYDRQTALDLWAPFESRHRYVFHLPPAFRLDGTPANKEVRSKWGTFALTVKAGDDPRELEFEFHTRLEHWRVTPEDFAAFRDFHEQVARSYRVWVTLEPTRDLADAPALETLLAVTPDADAAAALARLYVRHGRTADARRVLARARHYHPRDADLWELIVRAADSLKQEEAAYREMVGRFPGDPKYAIALASTLIDRGEVAEARKVLEPIARDARGAARGLAYYHLARAAFAEGQAEQALRNLDSAGDADSESVATVPALLFAGKVYEKLGRTKDAAATYREAVRAEPQSEDALLAVVRLSAAVGDRAEALDSLRRYTLQVGGDVNGLLRAAELYLGLGRYDDAFELASRARDIRFHEKAQRVLGLVHRHRGEHARAVFHLEKATPDAVVLEALIRSNLSLGRLHEAKGRAEQAERLADLTAGLQQAIVIADALGQRRKTILRALKVPEEQEEAWATAVERYLCAEYAWKERRPSAEVAALLEPAFGDGVTLSPAYALRGLLALERGRLSAALADAEKAIALSANEAVAYQVRGRVRLERAAAGALEDLQKAAELNGRRDAVTLHWLAAAQFRLGRIADAVATQREAVKLKPGEKELAAQLEEFEKAVKAGG
jgi:tetratricopeptide (TPR) repeat protein